MFPLVSEAWLAARSWIQLFRIPGDDGSCGCRPVIRSSALVVDLCRAGWTDYRGGICLGFLPGKHDMPTHAGQMVGMMGREHHSTLYRVHVTTPPDCFPPLRLIADPKNGLVDVFAGHRIRRT